MDVTRGEPARPRVVVSSVVSVDGRLALSGDQLLLHEGAGRVWRSLQPPSTPMVEQSRAALLERLYQPQVVLEGSGTFVTPDTGPVTGLPAADPALDLHTDFLPDDVAGDPAGGRWFAVVDSRGRVRWSVKSSGGHRLLILVAMTTPADYLAFLRREEIPYLVVGEDRVDPATALGHLAAKLGVTCVVSNAGGELNGALLRAELVDELHVVMLPALVGGKGTPALFDGAQLMPGELPTSLRLLSVQAETDGLIWLRYEVDRAARSAD
ncbi:RibD family protein [Catellatospora paridis]|uniref:RibD family protein n=1 Tax=Catellatospora paridis TaxID=1617086 RepID=UPI0012D39AB1|nr:dihydrofolate reductase family protein [Catellatospora paridis]